MAQTRHKTRISCNQMLNDDPENTCVSCAGHLEAISNEFKQCSEI